MKEYIKMRQSGQYRVEWFYEYYLKNGGKPVSLQEFHAIFSMGDLNQILVDMDKKFNLTSIMDKNGKFIKITT
jgi:hypothetical protein